VRVVFIILVLFISIAASGQFVDVTASKNFLPVKSSPLFGNGVSAADYDNDGDIDLYVCSAIGSPDHLYQNNEGNFTSVGDEVGLGSLDRSRMALWFDIDGDADLDLLVVGDCHLDSNDCEDESLMHLFRNEKDV
jgi:hypothetical protein